jgi:hypothetical protein
MTTSTGIERSHGVDPERADGTGRTPGTDRCPPDHSASGVGRSTRYRYLISLLKQVDTPVTIDRVVDPMFRWEHELTEGESSKSWGDVHEELFLVDLPVLERAGFVEFDRESGLVVASE